VSQSKPGTPLLGSCLNVLSVLLVIGTCLSAAMVAMVFASPGLVPEPFRVSTPLPGIATLALLPTQPPPPSPTETSLAPVFPPTWTPVSPPTLTPTRLPNNTVTSTPTPQLTATPTITLTPAKTFTRTPVGPSPTPTWTWAPFNYLMQSGNPTYKANTNTAGCGWLGIAGQVFDLKGTPVQDLYVHLEGNGLDVDAPTGSKPAYGPGGYELHLANAVSNTTDTYRVQVRDATGKALSDWYTIPTFQDCGKNLILVNFVQNH
jgi:hypothetical protein